MPRQLNPFSSKIRSGRSDASGWVAFFDEHYDYNDCDEKILQYGPSELQNDDTSTLTPAVPPPPGFKVRKVDHYFSRWTKEWKYQNSAAHVIPEDILVESNGAVPLSAFTNDEWKECCFIIVRELPHRKNDGCPYFKLVIKSPYLIAACKKVMGDFQAKLAPVNGFFEFNPKQFIALMPQFKAYRDELSLKLKGRRDDEMVAIKNIISTVDVLLGYYKEDYKDTLKTIEVLLSREEITFDLLHVLYPPGTVVLKQNHSTGELQAFRTRLTILPFRKDRLSYQLRLEGIDMDPKHSLGFTTTEHIEDLPCFQGAVKINSLDIYPLQYHPRQAEVRAKLIERGKKWAGLGVGVHHMVYNGTTSYGSGWLRTGGTYSINSRVMIDRVNYFKYCSSPPTPKNVNNKNAPADKFYLSSVPPNQVGTSDPLRTDKAKTAKLTDEDFLVASPIVFGFSLTDKVWLTMNVSRISEVKWNQDAFANLVIPERRKILLKSLVEAHNAELGFDDFIQGKGRGLVVNLFGPTGVGKTYSAEATCEHVKRPLYLIGAGDLGTNATELDASLQRAFDLASAWKAIILIDEADVFLEKRSMSDLERNAMVAVFLRHLEYYPAIIFLTTNRVKAFDDAFLSRIHVALHFPELDPESLRAVWVAFLKKVGATGSKNKFNSLEAGISEKELELLSNRKVNGRQVKNTVKTASSLAASRGELLRYEHLVEVLDVTGDFGKEFELA